MGQQYSKEVLDYRKKSKKEAKRLGFLPNKKAVVHPLNQAPKQTKVWSQILTYKHIIIFCNEIFQVTIMIFLHGFIRENKRFSHSFLHFVENVPNLNVFLNSISFF